MKTLSRQRTTERALQWLVGMDYDDCNRTIDTYCAERGLLWKLDEHGLIEYRTKEKSLLHRSNWSEDDEWFSNGIRIAWYDRHERLWTSYLIDSKKNQRGPAAYHTNRNHFEHCERLGHFSDDAKTLNKYIEDETY